VQRRGQRAGGGHQACAHSTRVLLGDTSWLIVITWS
jgi:hypothetical protein